MGLAWSKSELETLRQRYGKEPTVELAVYLNRTPVAVRQAAKKLGLGSGRYWSKSDLRTLRKCYGKVPGVALAKRLGITLSRLHRAAMQYGLMRPRIHWTPQNIAILRKRHGQGWSDSEIGAELGGDRHAISAKRRQLGLPSWYGTPGATWHPHGRKRVRERTRKQLEKAGVESIGQLRSQAYRKFALDNGWPEDLRPREVQILNALATHGPMTGKQIAEMIGMATDRKNSVHGGDRFLIGGGRGSYTANLLAHGLICYLNRSKPSGRQGVGRIPGLYMLTAEAITIIERRADVEREQRSSEAG